ncbi:MAG TPA: hypothetical protein VG649_12970 [Candidatus Angelobacter sp.]|jgi:hypothetical protein|nr:hypothetical protein [Candidatus Angelobacter sp.]
MKTRNQRELEKYWAKEATKKAKLAKKDAPAGENPKPAATPAAKETAKQ